MCSLGLDSFKQTSICSFSGTQFTDFVIKLTRTKLLQLKSQPQTSPHLRIPPNWPSLMQTSKNFTAYRLLARHLRSTRSLPQAVRSFSNPFGKTVQQEFGQEFNEDFLPDREALEIEHQMQNESRIALNRRPDDMLRHETDYNGILYKYDLPTENFPIVFRSQNQLAELNTEERLTSTENLMETLACDKDTAFESFIIKLQ